MITYPNESFNLQKLKDFLRPFARALPLLPPNEEVIEFLEQNLHESENSGFDDHWEISELNFAALVLNQQEA